MKKVIFTIAVIVLLLSGLVRADDANGLINGSFEDDNWINDITTEEPNGWDVNLPSDFYGWVSSDWVTEGSYNLTLYSDWYEAFEVNDTAMVSQEVYLTDVNVIKFDLKLEAGLDVWDADKCSAVLLIDDKVVWDSYDWLPDENDEYHNQVYTVDPNYNDANSHTLSLALRINVTETLYDKYYTQWDSVEFDPPCGGYGYLLEDFSQDCYVDFIDYAMMANEWLLDNPDAKYDLIEDGIVDEYDLGAFVDSWLSSSYD